MIKKEVTTTYTRIFKFCSASTDSFVYHSVVRSLIEVLWSTRYIKRSSPLVRALILANLEHLECTRSALIGGGFERSHRRLGALGRCVYSLKRAD